MIVIYHVKVNLIFFLIAFFLVKMSEVHTDVAGLENKTETNPVSPEKFVLKFED